MRLRPEHVFTRSLRAPLLPLAAARRPTPPPLPIRPQPERVPKTTPVVSVEDVDMDITEVMSQTELDHLLQQVTPPGLKRR